MHVDTLIHARWLITMEDNDEALENYSLAITNGKISHILPRADAEQGITAKENLDLGQHVLMPGLINAHTHTPMSLFRGLADDLPLMTWLNDHIWPAEAKWVHEEFVADGSKLAIAEMIRGGTTCFNDMYFYPDITAQVADHLGIRAMVGLILIDFPSAWANGPDEYISKGLALSDEYRHHPLIHCAFAPHAPYSVSDEPLSRMQTYANELDIPIHIHLHETEDEVNMGIKSHDKRPIARLNDLGMITPSMIAVHMTQLEDEEITLFAENNAHIVHCPESNLKLASGFCPVARLLDAGVNVALGTDGAASNNNLDMLSELRTAALLGKGVAKDATAIPAFQALKMATINGAKALGIADQTGSLKIGKSADLCAINLDTPETLPVYNPISQIVYASSREQVTDVWVAGEQLLKNRQLTRIDKEELCQLSKTWGERIAKAI